MKAYKKLLTQNLPMQNYLALNILLDKGRERLKKEKSYLSMVDNIEHSENLVMVDFQKKVLEIARDMATLTPRELYEYIREEKIS
ncbi:MAG: hypothetical protein E7314_05115 [Clostridiales bacterium]|nr:hypothetical protein [Clostridiales bacterium]